MSDYVKVFNTDKYVDICFYHTHEKPLAIGEKMEEICEEAYMNGYNWEAFFNCYLKMNAPELLEGLGTDPEADMYAAYYDITPENEIKGQKFGEIITHLIENEEELYSFIRDFGDEIEWD